MNHFFKRISLMACLMSAGFGAAADADQHMDLAAALFGVRGLRLSHNGAFELNYPRTQCINLSPAKSDEKVGLVCRSDNGDFIKDMGIAEFDTLEEATRPKERPRSGLVLATPMGQYGMTPMSNTNDRVAEATVDCDADSNAIYRATATCHVAVTTPFGGEVLYSNIVMTRNEGNRKGLMRSKIDEVWRKLKVRYVVQ